MIQTEWDSKKADANKKKHGISFALASFVFDDPHVFMEPERDIDGEERWTAIGIVNEAMLLLVVHTFISGPDEVPERVRIISARKVTTQERKRYDQNRSNSR